ncbi:LysM peptidoglycan-binding domain-containing protein [Thermodesulfobacteriota bacterium]
MKAEKVLFPAGFLFIVLILCLVVSHPSYGAFYYKSYIVRYDRGWDILCDQYVVKKNDWVIKLFKEKGEIAYEDFSEFLRIFKRINPHIRDTDLIRPGQHILIPLKKIRGSTLPGQSSGIVTIPFVTISSIPEALKAHSSGYGVQEGDCVSKLISRKFGSYHSKSYREGIKLFRLLNPEIKDLDLIYAGQKIRMPDPSMRNQPWYASVLDGSDTRIADSAVKSLAQPAESASGPFAAREREPEPRSPLEEAASILDSKLLNKGTYYLPQQDRDDLKLDLTTTPLLELKDGTRFLFLKRDTLQESDLNRIKSVWKNLTVIPVHSETATEKIFDTLFASFKNDGNKHRLTFADNGVEVRIDARWILKKPPASGVPNRDVCVTLIDGPEERTHAAIVRYLDQNNIILKDVIRNESADKGKAKPFPAKNSAPEAVFTRPGNRKSYVSDIITALGYRFAPDVMISFPYAGVQIEAVSNLISTGEGRPVLVDFGDLFGEAITAIEKTGFQVIQLKPEDNLHALTEKLLDAVDIEYSLNPTFFTAKRPVMYNASITIQGYLIDVAGKHQILITGIDLKDEVAQFLTGHGVTTIVSRFP